MESFLCLKRQFLFFGFSEPVLVMDTELTENIFNPEGHLFLLIPRERATMLERPIERLKITSADVLGPSPISASAKPFRIWSDNRHFALGVNLEEIVTMRQLIPGKRFQTWCSLRKNDTEIGFGFLKVNEANVSNSDGQQLSKNILDLEACLDRFRQSDLDKNLGTDQSFPDSDPSTGPSHSESQDFLEKSDVDTTYKLKNINSEGEGSNSAREVPEEIEDRIKVFGGKNIVYVMEKTLEKLDVQSSTTNPIEFSIPLCNVTRFLSDTEDFDLASPKYHEGFDAFLIGPSTDPDDVEVFNIKLVKYDWKSLYFRGAGWKDFVEKYGLAEGKKMQIWSFRRTTANTDSQIGASPSEIGFLFGVVDEDQAQ